MRKPKNNTVITGPWWIPKRLVEHVERYRKKHNLTKTAVHIEALELHKEQKGDNI